jgi:Outer membrane protein beta-barrel domain
MTKARMVAALACAGLLASVTSASAQGASADHGFLNVSGGYQASKQTVTSSASFSLYDETATVSTSRQIKGGGFFDVTGGFHVAGPFAIGLSFSARSAKSDATVQGSIPDPIFYDANRSVTSTASNLAHNEKWVGVLAAFVVPATDKIDVMLFVGPAVAFVKHDVPGSAAVVEAAGGPQITLATTSVKKSVWGFMGGVDLRYMFASHVGVGAFVRYDRARVNLSSSARLIVGGLQGGGGIRLKF